MKKRWRPVKARFMSEAVLDVIRLAEKARALTWANKLQASILAYEDARVVKDLYE